MIDGIIIIAYLLVMLGVGLYFSRRQRTEDSFFLASRDLGTFHVMASVVSTLIGGGMMFMIAALSYTYGISVIWFFISALVGLLVFSLAVPKIKHIADEHGCITLPELMEVKLDRKCMVIASIITIAVFSGFVAVNFLAASNILRIVFDVPLVPMAIVFAIIVVCYSILGGFKAVVWTDIIQLFIIIAGVSIVIGFSVSAAGGFGAYDALPATHKDPMNMGLPLIIGMFLSTLLSYFASQDIFQRIFAARSQRVAKHAVLLMGVLLLFVGGLIMLLGIYGKILFPDILADQVIPKLTTTYVPVGLMGIVLAAYLSMANSTADSELLTVTSNIMRDFYGRKRNLSPKEEVRASRVILVIVAAIALIMALSIHDITNIILSMFTWLGILGLAVIVTFFWKTTAKTVFWSLIVGFGSAITYTAFTGDFETSMLIGLIPTMLMLGIGSFFGKKL